jgi:hypothetical protein
MPLLTDGPPMEFSRKFEWWKSLQAHGCIVEFPLVPSPARWRRKIRVFQACSVRSLLSPQRSCFIRNERLVLDDTKLGFQRRAYFWPFLAMAYLKQAMIWTCTKGRNEMRLQVASDHLESNTLKRRHWYQVELHQLSNDGKSARPRKQLVVSPTWKWLSFRHAGTAMLKLTVGRNRWWHSSSCTNQLHQRIHI